MTSTKVRHHVNEKPDAVYRALIDPKAVARWMVPDGMTSEVHELDAREGGTLRVSLTYSGDGAGKSSTHTDTFHGHFTKLVPGQRVAFTVEFETEKVEMQGEMTMTFVLAEADGGTDVEALHDNLPPGLSRKDNETGMQMSLRKLASLVEAR